MRTCTSSQSTAYMTSIFDLLVPLKTTSSPQWRRVFARHWRSNEALPGRYRSRKSPNLRSNGRAPTRRRYSACSPEHRRQAREASAFAATHVPCADGPGVPPWTRSGRAYRSALAPGASRRCGRVARLGRSMGTPPHRPPLTLRRVSVERRTSPCSARGRQVCRTSRTITATARGMSGGFWVALLRSGVLVSGFGGGCGGLRVCRSRRSPGQRAGRPATSPARR